MRSELIVVAVFPLAVAITIPLAMFFLVVLKHLSKFLYACLECVSTFVADEWER